MHEQGERAQIPEGIGKRLAIGRVVSLGGLRRRVPALVCLAAEGFGHRKRLMGVESICRALEGQGSLVAKRHAALARGFGRQAAIAGAGRPVEAAPCQAVEDVREEGRLLQGRVHDARVVLHEQIRLAVLALLRDALVEGLWREGDGPLVQAKREPVRAQLLGRVAFQQLSGHGRLDRAGARGLLVHEEDVVVRDRRVLEKAPVEGFPEGRLGHAVEVDVVLPDELVDGRVVRAPPVAPVRARIAAFFRDRQSGLRERDRRPEALGPAPDREAFFAVDNGGRDSPIDVARDAEGHKRLARAEAHVRALEDGTGGVAVFPVFENDREGLLVSLGLDERMGGKLALDFVEGLAKGHLHVDSRVYEALPHGLRDHGAHLGVFVPLIHEAFEIALEGGEVEVPVAHGAQLGRGARELRDGGDELFWVELMAEVAFVGIGLLGFAAAHGAAALDLAAVQELPGLRVIELARLHEAQMSLLVKPADELRRELLVEGRCRLQARAREEVERDLEGLEGFELELVVFAHVVDDSARVAFVRDLLAVAFHDGGAIAVGAGDEDDVLFADAVAQEAREEVRGDENAAHVAKMQGFVAIGHAAGDDAAGGEGWTAE